MPCAGEMAVQYLALDFKGHSQKEKRHQPFINPEHQRLLQDKVPETDHDRRVVKNIVSEFQRRIHAQQRNAERADHHERGPLIGAGGFTRYSKMAFTLLHQPSLIQERYDG